MPIHFNIVMADGHMAGRVPAESDSERRQDKHDKDKLEPRVEIYKGRGDGIRRNFRPYTGKLDGGRFATHMERRRRPGRRK